MKKTLRFLVTVNAEVPEGGECFENDIGEGIQMGINHMMDAGELTGDVNKAVIIGDVSTCYLMDGEDDVNRITLQGCR